MSEPTEQFVKCLQSVIAYCDSDIAYNAIDISNIRKMCADELKKHED